MFCIQHNVLHGSAGCRNIPEEIGDLEREQRRQLVVEEGNGELLRRVVRGHLRCLKDLSSNLVVPCTEAIGF